jgi:membrane protease YdiL (CAAX protease family)
MQRRRAIARAVAFASAIPLVVLAAVVALAALPPGGAASLAVEALAAAATLALLAASGAALSRQQLAPRLGLLRGRLGLRSTLAGALGLLGLSHALEVLLQWSGVGLGPTLLHFDVALSGADPGAVALALAAFTLGSAVGEELFFRGLLQRGIEPVLGPTAAIALAAAAFGVAHADWTQGSAAFVLGLYLGALVHAGGSVRPAIVAHGVNNAAAVLEAAVGLRGPTHGPAVAIAVALGLGVAAAGLHGAGILGRTAGPAGPPGHDDARPPTA